MPHRRELALLLTLLAPSAAAAQVQLVRLEGSVIDGASQPVAHAVVAIHAMTRLGDGGFRSGAEVGRVTTDADGRFVVEAVPPGLYSITRVDVGGMRQSLSVTIVEGLPAPAIVQLPPLRDVSMMAGEGVGPPPARVPSHTAIDARSIAHIPRRGTGALQAAVATLPGWATEDNGLLHHRGVDDGFLYWIDGLAVYERLDRTSGIAPDLLSTDSLTVTTGYMPPEVGYKAGALISVQSRSAVDWRGLASIGAGGERSLDGGGSAGGPVGGGLTVWLAAGAHRTARFLDPVDPDNLHNRGGLGSTTGRFTASGARDRSVTTWRGGRSLFDVPNSRVQDAAGKDQRQRLGQAALTSWWQRTWSHATASQLAGYVRRHSARLDASGADTPITATADRRLTRAGALVGLTHQVGEHAFKVGAEAQRLRVSERFAFAVTDEDAAKDAGLSQAAMAFDRDGPFQFAGTARPTLFSFYVQDTWRPQSALGVSAGVRYDRTTLLLERQQWSPRLGVVYTTGGYTHFRAAIGRFYQPPQPENLLLSSSQEARALSPFVDGGADVEPERQWALEASVEHLVRGGLKLHMTYWRREVEHYADPNVFFGTTIIFPNAVAEGRAQGFDGRLEMRPGGDWSGYANLSVGKTTQTGPITGGLFLDADVAGIGPGVRFTPDHDQRAVASAGVTWTGDSHLTVSAVGRYESGTPIELDDDEEAAALADRPGADLVDFARGRVRPRTIVSVLGSVRLWEMSRGKLTLQASVLNLFGARYAYNFGNPFSGTHFGAPRTAAVSVRIETR